MYYVVIQAHEIKVLSYNLTNINELFQQIALEYNYEKETKDMQKMFGNFHKCGGILFNNCINRDDIAKGNRDQCIKICAELCPKKIPDYEEYLRQFITDIIIIISAESGEVWRNK